jgi:hypothetical protein
MSLLASINSAASLLGAPVEVYYFGTMLVYVSMLSNIYFYVINSIGIFL